MEPVKVGNITVKWPSIKQYMEGDLIVLAVQKRTPKFLFAASYSGDTPLYLQEDWEAYSEWTGLTQQDVLDVDTLIEFESEGIQYIIKFMEA